MNEQDQICRICLATGNNMISFFSNTVVENEETSINEMFAKLISSTKFLELPNNSEQFVCEKCVLSLKQAYLFKILCHLSQEYKETYSDPLTAKSTGFLLDSAAGDNGVMQTRSRSQTQLRISSSTDNLCTICNKNFAHPSILASHKRTHINSRFLNCNMCYRTFKKPTTLARHLTQYHKPCIQCNTCTKSFATEEILNVHKRIHSGAKHICSTCGKCFASASLLNFHSRSHVDKRKYTCSICGKAYIRPVHLTVHMRSHSGYKPFICAVCRKAYSQPNELQIHKCIDSDDQNSVCKICNKDLISQKALVRHLRLHTGPVHSFKLFKCNICGKDFAFSKSLAKHMKLHSDIKPYKCPLCNLEFMQIIGLKNHLHMHRETLGGSSSS